MTNRVIERITLSSAPCYKSCTILYTRLASRRAFLVLHLNDAVWQLEQSSSQYRVFTKIILFALQSTSSYTLKIEMPHLSGPRRYFIHHSYKVLSLQNYPSLAGKTVGTHIDRYRSPIMPLRFVRQAVANNTAQSLVLIVEFGAQRLAAVAARVPSLKIHIPFISTLRTSFCFVCGCPTQSKVPSRKTLSLRADLFGVAISWKRN